MCNPLQETLELPCEPLPKIRKVVIQEINQPFLDEGVDYLFDSATGGSLSSADCCGCCC